MTRNLDWPVALAVATAGYSQAFAAQYLTIEQAQRLMFSEADSFKQEDVQLSAEQMQLVEKSSGLPARSVHWRIFKAYKNNASIGYIVLDDVIGKYELISYAVAINPDASIRQVEILTYRESHGFEIRNSAWRQQFVGKHVQSGLVIGNGIANISGATLSCAHVTDGVRRIAAIAQIMLSK